MSKIKDIPMIKINMSKATCCKCGKREWPIDTEVFMFKGHVYCLCKECANKMEKMLRGEEI